MPLIIIFKDIFIFMRSSDKKFFIFFLFVYNFSVSFSQVRDSLQKTLSQKPKLTGGISTRYSFITGFATSVRCASLGAEFANKLRTGIGYCWLKLPDFDNTKSENQLPFYKNKYVTDASGNADTVVSSLNLNYLIYYSEFIFYRTKHWQFSIPFRAGIGNSFYFYDYLGTKVKASKRTVFLYEPSVCLEYKFFRFFGVGAEVGYTFMFFNNKEIQEKFNYPV